MAGLIANRGIAFLLIPFYTRVLNPETFAKLDLTTITVIILIPIFELAMGSALVRFYHFAETEHSRQKVVSTSFTFVLLSVLFSSIVMLILKDWISLLIYGDSDFGNLIFLITITVGVTVIGNQVLSLLRAQEKSISFALLNLIRATVSPAFIIVLVVQFEMGLVGVLLGDFIGLFVMLVFGFLISKKWMCFELDYNTLKSLIAFSLPLVPWALMTSIITLSDRYFLRAWVGYEDLAVYSLGFKIGMIMTLFTRAFQNAWPASAYQIAKEDDAEKSLNEIFKIVTKLSLFLAFLLSVSSPILIKYIINDSFYEKSYIYVPLVSVSYAVYLTILFVLTSIMVSNKTNIILLIITLSCILKILLNVVLIAYFDAVGAAIATLVASIFELYLSILIVRKVCFIDYSFWGYLLNIFMFLVGVYFVFLISFDAILFQSVLLILSVFMYFMFLRLDKYLEPVLGMLNFKVVKK